MVVVEEVEEEVEYKAVVVVAAAVLGLAREGRRQLET